MVERVLEVVPLWVIITAVVVVVLGIAYLTFGIGLIPTWAFWGMLAACVVGGIVGAVRGLAGGGL